jgi:hypothetical protein
LARTCKEVGADLRAIRDQITAFEDIRSLTMKLELSDLLLSSCLTAGGDRLLLAPKLGSVRLSLKPRDAEDLTNVLRKDGLLVDAVDNSTRPDISRATDHLRARVHLNSIVLVYSGGYGVESDGQNYLLPVDAKIWSEEDVCR